MQFRIKFKTKYERTEQNIAVILKIECLVLNQFKHSSAKINFNIVILVIALYSLHSSRYLSQHILAVVIQQCLS